MMIHKWMRPNEGRLHKGNPFKRIEKEFKRGGSSFGKEAGRVGKSIEGVASRAGENVTDSDWWEQAGASALAGFGDPRTWAAMGISGGSGMDILAGAESSQSAWDEMSDAARAEARAEIEAAQAAAEEARLMQEQEDAQREQERMTSERAREAEGQARERATRLGKGRRGLLYQGKETGVTSKLGG